MYGMVWKWFVVIKEQGKMKTWSWRQELASRHWRTVGLVSRRKREFPAKNKRPYNFFFSTWDNTVMDRVSLLRETHIDWVKELESRDSVRRPKCWGTSIWGNRAITAGKGPGQANHASRWPHIARRPDPGRAQVLWQSCATRNPRAINYVNSNNSVIPQIFGWRSRSYWSNSFKLQLTWM